ncbi:uncharacterized protein LOC114351465 [Ostrinia furnacalis]|uniref:uncharacterized protein LOC114351465 n=1 Tax=Ostrinia furnacalis TaxID=93504 RepID=UPI00103F9305|nr:uncharacterized protein LOC114351465 [Ostrinia furnacalis]
MKVKTMKMTVLLAFVLTLAAASPNDQLERYEDKVKTYKLDVPGKDPITIIEKATDDDRKWKDAPVDLNDDVDIKNLMTHIVHDVTGNTPRCFGPSCQDGFNGDEGPHDGFEDFTPEEKLNDYREFTPDRLQAITALAAKLKKEKLKADRVSYMDSEDNSDDDDDSNGKVYTTWNRLKVKQHKHPYDDKDGWVTLEPVAWSTSKISKWKPNVKKQKPNHWNDDDDRFPSDDRYTPYQEMDNSYSYPQKKPSLNRPGYINNKFHMPSEYESEVPSRPTWNKLQPSSAYPASWSPDEGRRPNKPSCDSDDNNGNDDGVYYGLSDSVVTDHRPSHFPYEYEALHQATIQKRPYRRPTQVVYAGSPELDSDRSRPPHGDGQWVLLSTTKGYRNKKRQRSLNMPPTDDSTNYGSVTSHQAVALTVLPIDNAHTNMTTSHGGLLEVEKSFQTVEESKRDLDKKLDLDVASSNNKPLRTKMIRRRVGTNVGPDSSTILAAVGAGMVPATMAMVVPMMLGRRRRRRDVRPSEASNLDNIFYQNQ